MIGLAERIRKIRRLVRGGNEPIAQGAVELERERRLRVGVSGLTGHRVVRDEPEPPVRRDRAAELLAVEAESCRVSVRADNFRLREERSRVVDCQVLHGDIGRVINDYRQDPAVEDELRAAAVYHDVVFSDEGDCYRLVARVVVRDIVVFCWCLAGEEMVGSAAKLERAAVREGIERREKRRDDVSFAATKVIYEFYSHSDVCLS